MDSINADHLPMGTLLQHGRYRVIRFLSSGGFGCTYEAVHVKLGKRLCIKEFFVKDFCNREDDSKSVSVGIRSKAELVDKLEGKFAAEAQALSNMNHHGIVKVIDIFEENNTAYFVMDYIEGQSLQQMVKATGPMTERRAVGYILQVAEALKYVHSHNRLHLDIKPGNIMVNKQDEAILIDFGASKQYDEANGENTSTIVGSTPGYAPIEQTGNDLVKFSPSTDIYSLGATLYYLFVGKTPISATQRISGDELDPLPQWVSPRVRDAIFKSMSISKKSRPQTVDEFVALLVDSPLTSTDATVVNDTTTATHHQTHQDNTSGNGNTYPSEYYDEEPKRKSKLPLILGIIFLAVCGGTAAYFLLGNNSGATDDSNKGKLIYDKSTNELVLDQYRYKFVEVDGGSFDMGKLKEIPKKSKYKVQPVHNVTLSPYYIGATEVPQWLWETVMGKNPSRNKGPMLPVEMVSWDDCQQFISALIMLTGEDFDLPTEAQWEFAAKGGKNSNDYYYSGSNTLDEVAWYKNNSGNSTHEVGTKAPNELGLYDMSGNVFEWTNDYEGDYAKTDAFDPTGPERGSKRIRRGGSFNLNDTQSQVAYRASNMQGNRYEYLGLRLSKPKR